MGCTCTSSTSNGLIVSMIIICSRSKHKESIFGTDKNIKEYYLFLVELVIDIEINLCFYVDGIIVVMIVSINNITCFINNRY